MASLSDIPERIGIAVVENGEKVLVGVRGKHQALGGKHEFPGGRCLTGESPAECALRECQEETGLRVEIVRLLDHTVYEYEHGQVDLHFYLCRPSGESQPSPAAPYCWISRDELGRLDFPAGNRNAVVRLTFPRGEASGEDHVL